MKKYQKIVITFLAAALIVAPLYVNKNATVVLGKTVATTSKQNNTNKKKAKDKQIIVAVDAGHQQYGNSGAEPIGPGASTKKAKVSGGTSGVSTGKAESELTLEVAKKLNKELTKRGYKVIMIRTKQNVNISNKQRAIKANKSGAKIYIRLHADGSSSRAVRGATALYPSTNNPYVKNLSKKSKKLSECILNSYCSKTEITNRGLAVRDDLTGTNWSKIPVTLIEMGFMTNSTEDQKMNKDTFQKKMSKGIADGVDKYFNKKTSSKASNK